MAARRLIRAGILAAAERVVARLAKPRGRAFVRDVTSHYYSLKEVRREQLRAPRVRGDEIVVDDGKVGHSGHGPGARSWHRLAPSDDPFLTQNLQVHFVELAPGDSNLGHGHQNEAVMYILEGKGYEIHDGIRYDWKKGDLVLIHTDSVHRHFNASENERALGLIIKAKPTWIFFGLVQQGRDLKPSDAFGPREEWSALWTPGVTERKKIIGESDARWETTRDGRVRILCSNDTADRRIFSVDLYEQEIGSGGRSAKHWHMPDEVVYVLSGSGYSLHWEVDAEIADRYYAHIAKSPTRHDFSAGDLLYVPQNTVHQHFNSSGEQPLLFLCAQNRLIKFLGYDKVVYLEDAPESILDKTEVSPTDSV